MKTANGHIIGANYLKYNDFSLWRFLTAKLSVFLISFVLFQFYYLGGSPMSFRKASLFISCAVLFVPIIILMIRSFIAKRFLNDYLVLTALMALLVLFDYNKEAYYLIIFFSLIDMIFYAVKRLTDTDIEKIEHKNPLSYRVRSGEASVAGAEIYLSANEICPAEAEIVEGRSRCINLYSGEEYDAGVGDKIVSNTKIIAGDIIVKTLCDLDDSFYVSAQTSAKNFEKGRKKLNTNDIIYMILQGISLTMAVLFSVMRNSLGDEKAILVFITIIVGFFSFSSFSTVVLDVSYKRFSKFISQKGVSVNSRDEIDLLAICKNPYDDFPSEEELDERNKKILYGMISGVLRVLRSRMTISTNAAFDKESAENSDLALVSRNEKNVFKVVFFAKRFKKRLGLINVIKVITSLAAILMFFSTADFASFYAINLAGYLAMAIYSNFIR